MRFFAILVVFWGFTITALGALSIFLYTYETVYDQIEEANYRILKTTDGRIFDLEPEQIAAGSSDFATIILKNSNQMVLVKEANLLAHNPIFSEGYFYGSYRLVRAAEAVEGTETAMYVETVTPNYGSGMLSVAIDVGALYQEPFLNAKTRRYLFVLSGIIVFAVGCLLLFRRRR